MRSKVSSAWSSAVAVQRRHIRFLHLLTRLVSIRTRDKADSTRLVELNVLRSFKGSFRRVTVRVSSNPFVKAGSRRRRYAFEPAAGQQERTLGFVVIGFGVSSADAIPHLWPELLVGICLEVSQLVHSASLNDSQFTPHPLHSSS